MEYTLYQVLKQYRSTHGFMNMEEREAVLRTTTVDLGVYHKTYAGQVADEQTSAVLEHLFHQFNLEHPADFKSYSMSVGDIVKLSDTWWYCDSFGWKQIVPTGTPLSE